MPTHVLAPMRVLALLAAVAGLSRALPCAALSLVERRAIVPAGEGVLSMGAGTWLRDDGAVTVGHLDLRVGLRERLELRVLLPGLAFEALVEAPGRPAVVVFGGLCEVGFNSIRGSTVAYQVGARVTKRVLGRLRLSAQAELRHRFVGQENAELAVSGPLPANRAFVGGGEVALSLHAALAVVGGLGYSAALGDGRSFGYGSAGLVGTIADRLDLYVSALLERSRADRAFAPAVFAGIALRF